MTNNEQINKINLMHIKLKREVVKINGKIKQIKVGR